MNCTNIGTSVSVSSLVIMDYAIHLGFLFSIANIYTFGLDVPKSKVLPRTPFPIPPQREKQSKLQLQPYF